MLNDKDSIVETEGDEWALTVVKLAKQFGQHDYEKGVQRLKVPTQLRVQYTFSYWRLLVQNYHDWCNSPP
jgi:hypothetical protein